jgi:hypothetical protein
LGRCETLVSIHNPKTKTGEKTVKKNSKGAAGVTVRKIAFESRADLIDYLHSQGVRWNELNKLNKKKK